MPSRGLNGSLVILRKMRPPAIPPKPESVRAMTPRTSSRSTLGFRIISTPSRAPRVKPRKRVEP